MCSLETNFGSNDDVITCDVTRFASGYNSRSGNLAFSQYWVASFSEKKGATFEKSDQHCVLSYH